MKLNQRRFNYELFNLDSGFTLISLSDSIHGIKSIKANYRLCVVNVATEAKHSIKSRGLTKQ